MDTKMKKDDLIAALQDKKRAAATLDREAAKKYAAERKAVIAARRAWFREWAKAPEAELEKFRTWGHRQSDAPEIPGCPISWLGRVEREIKMLQLDCRKTITLSMGQRELLTLGDKPRNTICESLGGEG